MARNRMIKAEFWADEKIGSCSPVAQLLFIGSWNFADDSGVCRANIAYLRNNIFPYGSLTCKQVEDALLQLKEKELILIGEYKNEKYFLVKNFLKHQTIKKPSAYRYVEASYDEIFKEYSPSTPLVTHQLPLKEKEKEKEKEKVEVEVEVEAPASAFEIEQVNTSDWYGEYCNVHLTETQHQKLLSMVLDKKLLDAFVNELSENIAAKKDKAKPYDEKYPDMHFIAVKSYWQYFKTHPNKFKTLQNAEDDDAQLDEIIRQARERNSS